MRGDINEISSVQDESNNIDHKDFHEGKYSPSSRDKYITFLHLPYVYTVGLD